MQPPDSMQYVQIAQPGAPDVLKLTTGPTPAAGPGQLLVRVTAAGVNRPDVLQRLGKYRVPPNASPIPGLEVCGDVVATGDGVSAFSVGDRVCALANGGGYAEYVAIPAGQCLPVPESLSAVEAAALPETFFTVWANVFDAGRLQPGETFLVHGGSSGIGTTAIQLAKALGARAFATAGSAAKCAACTDLGAELAVNYREADFVEALTAATDGKGIDVILDMVGGDYVDRNVRVAARDGRIVIIASLRGRRGELDIGQVMVKRLVVTGSLLRPRTDAQKAAIADALKETVWPLIEAGKVRPVIHRVFPLAEASAAHALMESSEHIGKLVLDVAGTHQG
ncbi:MAG: NAD(P)H-quinone oxidoreductase [Pseudomonadota bacterium]